METLRPGAPQPSAPGFQAPAALTGASADPHAVLLANLLRDVLLNAAPTPAGSPMAPGCGVRDLAGALRSLAAALDAVGTQPPASPLGPNSTAGMSAPRPMPMPHTPPGYRSMATSLAA